MRWIVHTFQPVVWAFVLWSLTDWAKANHDNRTAIVLNGTGSFILENAQLLSLDNGTPESGDDTSRILVHPHDASEVSATLSVTSEVDLFCSEHYSEHDIGRYEIGRYDASRPKDLYFTEELCGSSMITRLSIQPLHQYSVPWIKPNPQSKWSSLPFIVSRLPVSNALEPLLFMREPQDRLGKEMPVTLSDKYESAVFPSRQVIQVYVANIPINNASPTAALLNELVENAESTQALKELLGQMFKGNQKALSGLDTLFRQMGESVNTQTIWQYIRSQEVGSIFQALSDLTSQQRSKRSWANQGASADAPAVLTQDQIHFLEATVYDFMNAFIDSVGGQIDHLRQFLVSLKPETNTKDIPTNLYSPYPAVQESRRRPYFNLIIDIMKPEFTRADFHTAYCEWLGRRLIEFMKNKRLKPNEALINLLNAYGLEVDDMPTTSHNKRRNRRNAKKQ